MPQIVTAPIAAQAAPIPIASSRKRPSRSNAGGAWGGDLSASGGAPAPHCRAGGTWGGGAEGGGAQRSGDAARTASFPLRRRRGGGRRSAKAPRLRRACRIRIIPPSAGMPSSSAKAAKRKGQGSRRSKGSPARSRQASSAPRKRPRRWSDRPVQKGGHEGDEGGQEVGQESKSGRMPPKLRQGAAGAGVRIAGGRGRTRVRRCRRPPRLPDTHAPQGRGGRGRATRTAAGTSRSGAGAGGGCARRRRCRRPAPARTSSASPQTRGPACLGTL